MNIHRILAVATGIALAGSLGTGVALAQGPNSEECDNARQAVIKLETQFQKVAAEERVSEQDDLDKAQADLRAAQVEVDKAKTASDADPNDPILKDALKTAREVRDTAKDTRDRAQRDLNTDSNKLAGLRAQLNLALQDRDRECSEPTSTPAPAPTDTLDCNDFATHALAQAEFDKDRNDPHNLDSDNDNRACEIHFGLNDDDDNAPVPSGGVDTGDGSSL